MKIKVEVERRFENKTTIEINEVEEGSFEDLEHLDIVLCYSVSMKAVMPHGKTAEYKRIGNKIITNR